VTAPARARPTALAALAVLPLAAAAWVAVALAPRAGAHAHGALTGWTVMVVAMMLPPALPMLGVLRTLTARRRTPGLLTAAGGAAFVLVWTLVGALLLGVTGAVATGVATVPWLAAHPPVVAGTAVAAAGAYQFAPWKDACLTACRSPRGFAARHWHGESPLADVATLAGAYALSCAGCCVALMAVAVVVGGVAGAAALPVMLVLATVMAAERVLPGGRALVRPVGAALLGAGALLVLGPLAAGLLPG
jgi:predicted metal-binding membrane protein